MISQSLPTFSFKKLFKIIFLGLSTLFFSATAHADATTGKIEVNGIQLYYEIHGNDDAPPMVLIAGFTCDHTFWAGIVKTLAEKYRVITFDNRGVGQTDAPDSPYTVAMMADDVIGLIDNLKLEKPIIVGQSMGSAIAQNLSKRFPDRISKIILINTFPRVAEVPMLTFTAIGNLQKIKVPLKNRVEVTVPWIFSSHFLSQPNQLENLIKLNEDNPHPQSLIGYENQLAALREFNSKPWLKSIKNPALVIAGREDLVAPLADAHAVADVIEAKLVILPGGHGSPIEQPDAVIENILKFTE